MDPRNQDHVRLAALLEERTAMPYRPISGRQPDYIRDALRNARFEVEAGSLVGPEHGLHPSQAMLPWYETLATAIKDPRTIWASHRNNRPGRFGSLTRSAAEVMIEAGKLGVRLIYLSVSVNHIDSPIFSAFHSNRVFCCH